ncbi:hypothetical protein SAMN05421856_102548 [Chryseobacterium taichungense]|uniref:Uncharacterized protein n=1 Tax=Chryseobacterium taichungense TaxID=295069 RepID=A0A1H7XN40_9FLAO|nr:hypothetical protein [Chryseobacterium taichungense]SEM35044.1 hypothetical protein SAMN05421856_102548 [Chryseobacterium taichungense]
MDLFNFCYPYNSRCSGAKINEDSDIKLSSETKEAYLKLLDAQRAWLIEQNHDEKQYFDEDLIRKHLMKIDLEEERILLIH